MTTSTAQGRRIISRDELELVLVPWFGRRQKRWLRHQVRPHPIDPLVVLMLVDTSLSCHIEDTDALIADLNAAIEAEEAAGACRCRQQVSEGSIPRQTNRSPRRPTCSRPSTAPRTPGCCSAGAASTRNWSAAC